MHKTHNPDGTVTEHFKTMDGSVRSTTYMPMSKNRSRHPLAGDTVQLNARMEPEWKEYKVEDWAINVFGKSWMHMDGNPACMKFGIRSGLAGLPTDDEVLYGKIGPFGELIHISEVVGYGDLITQAWERYHDGHNEQGCD